MYVKKVYGFWMTFNWSKRPFILGTIYAGVVSLVFYYFDITTPLPWQPISLIGITVAFYLGFKNNSSYDRTWEARKIWGSIVNNSRTWGAAVLSFVQGEQSDVIKKELVYRHLAWITALRHQLRLSREWEHVEDRVRGLYSLNVSEDYHNKLDKELAAFLPQEEIDKYVAQTNTATQILAQQSQRLQALRDQNHFEDFRHMEFHHLIQSFYEDQGKSERIKNFPFPRQYASATLWVTMVFSAALPFGMIDIFQNTGLIWLGPFLSGLIIWVFFLMEKIGDYSENPFEGSYNDVPITSISRGIEIDLREMLGDSDIPPPINAENGIVL